MSSTDEVWVLEYRGTAHGDRHAWVIVPEAWFDISDKTGPCLHRTLEDCIELGRKKYHRLLATTLLFRIRNVETQEVIPWDALQ